MALTSSRIACVRVMGPLKVTPRFYDRVDLTEGGKALIDSIQMRLFGILVGRVTIRRTPTSA
jgi:hypothetical protein